MNPSRRTLILAGLLAAGVSDAALARQEDPNAAASPMEWTGEVEIGYRTRDLDGSEALYDSHTNMDSGTRLMSLRFQGVPTGPASGRIMDTFSVEAYGLGGDPQEYFRVGAGKRGAYRWEVRGMRQAYVFNVPTFAVGGGVGNEGQHTNNQTDRTLDASLQATPGRFTLNFGYAHRAYEGPGFTTWDFSRDEFFIFGRTDRETDDYRAEVSFPAGAWTFSFEQMVREHESLNNFDLAPGEFTGNSTTNQTTLNSFFRDVPLEGSTWTSRVSARTTFAERVDLAARVLHSQGDTDFTSLQRAVGTTFAGAAIDEAIAGRGESERPADLGEVGVTVSLTEKWEVASLSRYSTYEIEGQTREETVTNAGAPVVTVEEHDVDLSSFDQRAEVAFRPARRWTLRAGARLLSRDTTITVNGVEEDADTTATTWYGSVGARFGPKVNGYLEYQDGEQDNLFTRVEPAEFQAARLRAQWKPLETLDLSTSVVFRHGENPNPDNRNDVDSWSYSLAGSFHSDRWRLSAGANRVDLDSETTIFFFATGVRTQGVSLYELQANNYFADGEAILGKRFKTGLRYQLVDATGSFPVDYQTVEPRFSIKILEHVWINGAFYRYKYQENDDPAQDYEVDGYRWSATFTL